MTTGGKQQENGVVHQPVLLHEVIHHLRPVPGGIYVDGTLGLGGHTRAVLESSAPDGRVIGLEWDTHAARIAAERLAAFGSRVHIVSSSYAELPRVLREENCSAVDGLLLDLGVSSLQLDDGRRGFSFRSDAPLDMRMNPAAKTTAAQLLARLDADELADIFFYYGQERQARRIAAHLVGERKKRDIATTGQLADLVAEAVPQRYHPRKIHVATRVFQALRIAVNRELDNLERILNSAPALLKTRARFCVITFHSLEDRIVKRAFTGNPGYRMITGRPIAPAQAEKKNNPRSRSAKLRVAEAT